MTLPTPEDTAPDPRPLHARIAADLRDAIMNGELAPGSKVPSTARLKERFDASNATIQKALQILKAEGLVVGRAGAAVTVRENRQRTVRPASSLTPATAGAAYPWLAQVAGPARAEARSELVGVGEADVHGDVAAALGQENGSPALLRHQLITVDGEPAELVSSYYPLDIARAPHSPNPAGSGAGVRPCSRSLAFHRARAWTVSPHVSPPRLNTRHCACRAIYRCSAH